MADALRRRFPGLVWNAAARTVFLAAPEAPAPSGGPVLIVSAGTSDLPVAEEAAVVAEAFGTRVERLMDVGVAGLHRLLSAGRRAAAGAGRDRRGGHGRRACRASSAGWWPCRSSRCRPASGYGASFGGLAALLGMLNSCAAGVTVVNIDNGFGAAAAASRICRA